MKVCASPVRDTQIYLPRQRENFSSLKPPPSKGRWVLLAKPGGIVVCTGNLQIIQNDSITIPQSPLCGSTLGSATRLQHKGGFFNFFATRQFSLPREPLQHDFYLKLRSSFSHGSLYHVYAFI